MISVLGWRTPSPGICRRLSQQLTKFRAKLWGSQRRCSPAVSSVPDRGYPKIGGFRPKREDEAGRRAEQIPDQPARATLRQLRLAQHDVKAPPAQERSGACECVSEKCKRAPRPSRKECSSVLPTRHLPTSRIEGALTRMLILPEPDGLPSTEIHSAIHCCPN